MLNPGMYGDAFMLLPIYAAAVLLGVVSGIVAIHVFTNAEGRLTVRSLLGIVALAAVVCCLVAARADFWHVTASFWAMAAVVMAFVDLLVVRLIDPWRATQRFSRWPVRRRVAWPIVGIAGSIAGVMAVLKLCFDIPDQIESLLSVAAELVVATVTLATLDLAGHLALVRWHRMRKYK